MSNFGRSLGLILVLAAAPRCESESGNPLRNPEMEDSPEIRMATVGGGVTNGGSRISGAAVSLRGGAWDVR